MVVGVVNPPHEFAWVKLFIFLLQPLLHFLYRHLLDVLPYRLHAPPDVLYLHAKGDDKQDRIEEGHHDQEDPDIPDHHSEDSEYEDVDSSREGEWFLSFEDTQESGVSPARGHGG